MPLSLKPLWELLWFLSLAVFLQSCGLFWHVQSTPGPLLPCGQFEESFVVVMPHCMVWLEAQDSCVSSRCWNRCCDPRVRTHLGGEESPGVQGEATCFI